MLDGNIKRLLSAGLLLAFTGSSALALEEAVNVPEVVINNSSSVMSLKSGVDLTDNNNIITLSLRDSDVKQVLRMFADKAGLNIVFHNTVNGKVTLDLVNTPINNAFNLVLEIAGLSYYKQGNTMIVMSKDSPDNAMYSKQEMMVFPINYVSAEKIANFLNKNVFSMKKPGMSSIDAATVNSATNELIVFGMPSDEVIIKKVIEQFDKEPYTKTFAVNHTTPAEMADMICNFLLPSRGIGAGSESSSSSSSGSSGAKPKASGLGGMTGGAADASGGDSLKLGEGVIACSVSSQSSTDNVSPFDMQNLSIAYFPQRGTITLMGGSENQAKMIERFIKLNDVKQPQAFLEVSIVELNENGSKDFQNQWQIQSRNWGASFDGQSFSGGRPGFATGGNYYSKTEYIWDGGNQAPGQAPNGNPYLNTETGEFVVPNQIERIYKAIMPSTTYVSWMMNYIIQNRKGRVLANPKILITNGQESIIDLTQDYVEKVTSEYLTSSYAGQSGTTGTVQRDYTIADDLGIKVTLVPFISPEGYVTLNIKPEYSTIAEQIYTIGNASSRDLVATLLSRRDLDLKNVRIKDGETLVIGGLIQESETKSVNKIPFLGDLPIIGTIFRSSSTSRTKSELVIMITPKILNDGDDTVVDDV